MSRKTLIKTLTITLATLLVLSVQVFAAEDIAAELLKHNSRGVTFLEGEGAYFHQKKKVILSITNLTDLPKMKELVLKSDPRAFVVINDTVEVLGARYGAPRSY